MWSGNLLQFATEPKRLPQTRNIFSDPMSWMCASQADCSLKVHTYFLQNKKDPIQMSRVWFVESLSEALAHSVNLVAKYITGWAKLPAQVSSVSTGPFSEAAREVATEIELQHTLDKFPSLVASVDVQGAVW